jgi:hypothetical protein
MNKILKLCSRKMKKLWTTEKQKKTGKTNRGKKKTEGKGNETDSSRSGP